jgi:hypothetical protein
MAVTSLLAATRLPPMPETLVHRIDVVIASESTARAARITDLAGAAESGAQAPQPDDAEPALIPGRPDLPERARRARPRRRFRLPSLSSPLVLRGLAATAVVVVVAGAGFLLANGQSQPRTPASSKRVHTARPKAAAIPSAKGIANAALRNRVSVDYQLNGKTVTTTAFVSKSNFLRRTLARQVREDVRQAARLGPTYGQSASAAPSQPKPTNSFSLPEVASCLSGINAGRTVLLVAVARFLGKPARIIVLRSAASASILDIAIVGPACSASSLDLIFRTTIPAG